MLGFPFKSNIAMKTKNTSRESHDSRYTHQRCLDLDKWTTFREYNATILLDKDDFGTSKKGSVEFECGSQLFNANFISNCTR